MRQFMHRIKCSWDGNMKFTAKDEFDHNVSMDIANEGEEMTRAFRPMPMILVGLGGCMGVDIKMLLEKMKQNITSLEQDKIERAIALAEEKYCNVSAMLSRICELEHKAVIV